MVKDRLLEINMFAMKTVRKRSEKVTDRYF